MRVLELRYYLGAEARDGADAELQGAGTEAGRKRPTFGEALLREGIDTVLAGDVDTGKAILRDYIKATVRFEKLGEAIGTQPKSLIRSAAIRRPATSSASSATSRNKPASSSTSHRGRGNMGSRFRERKRATMHYFLVRTTRC